jgi:hypothetical protein
MKIMKIKVPYHNYYFLFGFFFYLILPFLLVKYDLTGKVGEFLRKFYDSQYDGKYIKILILFFLAFYSGSFLVYLFPKKYNNTAHKELKRTNTLQYITPITFCISIFILLKYSFESNYLEHVGNPILGFSATLTLIFSFFILYDNVQGYKRRYMVFFVLFLLFLFLLRTGTRMYFLISVIMLLTYCKEKFHFKTIKLLSILLCATLIIFFVGIVRLGNDTNVNILFNIVNLIQEPAYTWLSAGSFLQENPELPIFAMPYNFLSSFINFIPRFLLPNKTALFADIPFDFQAPLGACSIFTSLIGNFGVVGSAIFLFVMGLFSSIIFFNTHNKFCYVYYIAYSAILPFQFFRDPLSIINKSVFFNFLLLPLVLIFVCQMFNETLKSKT